MTEKTKGPIQKMVTTIDAWLNSLTGLGSTKKDKRTAGWAEWRGLNTERDCEEIYAADSFNRRIADLLPYEATRQWLEFKMDDNAIKKTQDEVERLMVQPKTAEAWSWGRVYGGGLIFLNTGLPPEKLEEPLDMKNIQQLISLVVLNRHELLVQTNDIETNLNDPNYGLPKQYRLAPKGVTAVGSNLGTNPIIHHTHLVRFDGMRLPTQLKRENEYWDDSIYSGLWEALRDFGISYASIASVVQEFRTLVYKLKGLTEAVAAGKLDAIKKRLEVMNLSRSVIGAYLIDAEDETIEGMSATVTGIADLIKSIDKRMQAATDIPHTILFNESPSGLGASGRAEERMWYDFVASQQNIYYAPRLDRIFEVMFAAKRGPTNGEQPKDWTYKFNQLFRPDPKQEADAYKLNADGDKTYIDTGTLSSEEVRKRRFPEEEQL